MPQDLLSKYICLIWCFHYKQIFYEFSSVGAMSKVSFVCKFREILLNKLVLVLTYY